MEIAASPELSNLDEEAFRPVASGVSVNRILSLAEQPVEAGDEKDVTLNDQTPIALETSMMESAHVIAAVADVRPVRSNSEMDQTFTRAEDENESKNRFFTLPEGDDARRAAAVKREAALKSTTARGSSQQMCFNWS